MDQQKESEEQLKPSQKGMIKREIEFLIKTQKEWICLKKVALKTVIKMDQQDLDINI